MERFELLNAIVGEFAIKEAALDLFGVKQLVWAGRDYQPASEPLVHAALPQIVYDDVLSDCESAHSLETPDTTFGTVNKLVSDGEVLSSDFTLEPGVILTSE